AGNVATLDAARALQGIGGAALYATALALIGAEYQGPARMSAIAIWGATVGFSVAAGPLFGGIITDSLSWRWIFFVNIPVGAAALALAVRAVRESRDAAAQRTDIAGLATFSAAFCLGAGMFALFPFISIYLQDVDGFSPLGAGLRFLPITAFVFLVPLVTRKRAAGVELWLLLGGSLAITAVGLALLEMVSVGSDW